MIEELYIDNYNGVFSNYELIDNKIKLNRINIFVGANNSGKSRFLRELFKEFRKKELSEGFGNIDLRYIKKDDAIRIFEPVFASYIKPEPNELNVESAEKLVCNFKKRFQSPNHYNPINEEVIKNTTKPSLFKDYLSFNEYLKIVNELNFTKGGLPEIVTPHNDLRNKIVNREKSNFKDISYSTYIPVMRSLKKVDNDKNLYKKRIFDDYFSDFSEIDKTNIFTGEDLFSIIHQTKNSTDRLKRQEIDKFNKFIQEHFTKIDFEILPLDNLGNDKVGKLIHNNRKDLTILLGEEERLISSFGDGIQSLIILLFPLFIHQNKKHLLFIDEPELNLHPGMQRLFIETLNRKEFDNTQVFISTHSNHFLNTATELQNEISVFSFKKNNNSFKITDISQRAVQALDLLGVNNSSVFLANCTIWIEGISERLYIRKYLELYCESQEKKKFKEDSNFAFIEYSGSNIKHWSFFDDNEGVKNMNFEAISNNVFVIADNDGKDEEHKLLEEKLGDIYNPLKCREIENLLSPDVLKKTLYEYRYKKEKIDFKNLKFSKEVEYKDYKDIAIGEYIYDLIIKDNNQITESLLSTPKKNAKRKIKDKKEFTKRAINNINNWNDLSQYAKNLTERIYKFIEKNNQ